MQKSFPSIKKSIELNSQNEKIIDDELQNNYVEYQKEPVFERTKGKMKTMENLNDKYDDKDDDIGFQKLSKMKSIKYKTMKTYMNIEDQLDLPQVVQKLKNKMPTINQKYGDKIKDQQPNDNIKIDVLNIIPQKRQTRIMDL